jgi:hypothetical protein
MAQLIGAVLCDGIGANIIEGRTIFNSSDNRPVSAKLFLMEGCCAFGPRGCWLCVVMSRLHDVPRCDDQNFQALSHRYLVILFLLLKLFLLSV